MKAAYDENGKWIPPYKGNSLTVKGDEYEAQGVSERSVSSIQDIIDIMQIVEATRTAKGHNLNHRSSRSHCIVTLKCQKKVGKGIQSSKFHFVDLAGSERIHKSGATDLKAEEAKSINLSLSNLGRCI